MMGNEFDPRPPLQRSDIEERLARDEHLESIDLHDLDLAGLPFRGKRFTGSTAYGVRLWRGEFDANGVLDPTTEVRTDIRETDWTDAVFASVGQETFFGRVDAARATFGFSESLADRRRRHTASGEAPTERDSGGYHNFNGAEGNFASTTWKHIDFGGGSGYEAQFGGANLSKAAFTGCDLSAIDLSSADVDGIRLEDCGTRGLRMQRGQMDAIADGIVTAGQSFSDQYGDRIAADGLRATLQRVLGVEIVDAEEG